MEPGQALVPGALRRYSRSGSIATHARLWIVGDSSTRPGRRMRSETPSSVASPASRRVPSPVGLHVDVIADRRPVATE
jgi:hypothetical protein